jgi:pSer/pThr/pTyr-binding forkhead associated (FHA) protein
MVKLVVKAPLNENETKNFNYDFDQPVITIGRLKDNDIPLPLSTISGFHAQILKEGENHYLLDRGSINGTYLNGQRLVAGEKKLLHDGDTIRIQTFDIYFSSGITVLNLEQGATVQVARQMVMEVLGAWESKAQEKPRLIIMGGAENGRQFELSEQKSLIIGREANSDIQVDHPSVSRRHAEIAFTWSGAFLKDLNSSNGVYVNDQRIAGGQKLHDRDMVKCGQQTSDQPVLLVYSDPAEALLSRMEDKQLTESAPPDMPLPQINVPAASPQTMTAQGSQSAVAPSPSSAPVPTAPAGSRGFPVIGYVVMVIGAFVICGIAYLFFMQHPRIVVEQVTPAQGFSGQSITISGKELDSAKVKMVRIYQETSPILKRDEHSLVVRIPEFRNVDSEKDTEVVVQDNKGEIGRLPFKLIAEPGLRGISPESGAPGSEVHVSTIGSNTGMKVYFEDVEVSVRSTSSKEIVVVAPAPATIPREGLPMKVTVRSYGTPIKNSLDFTVLPPAVVESDRFQLAFMAKPFTPALGFNEYCVETNLGPLLVLVARDEYAGSQERAEKTAANLSEAIDVFRSDPTEKVALLSENNALSIVAQGDAGDKRLLLRVFPEDAIAYGKISGRVIAPDELGQWWQMLLDSYFRVFVQVADPSSTGIVATGGAIFQQIYSFYPVEQGGQKFFKRDFLTALAADQKEKLLGLSLKLPPRVARVDGKWNGIMSNNLYHNISEDSLELILNFRQNDHGAISGNAEINWKIVMGQGQGGFQNVAIRKLGIFGLSGSYQKTKAYPLEFSVVEKDGRRLNFVGRLDGDILGGSYLINSTGEEGTWSARLAK